MGRFCPSFLVGTVLVFCLVVGIGLSLFFLFGSRNEEGYGMETVRYPLAMGPHVILFSTLVLPSSPQTVSQHSGRGLPGSARPATGARPPWRHVPRRGHGLLAARGQRRGHSLPGGAQPTQGFGQPDATLPAMVREGRSPNEGAAWRGKAHRTVGDDGIVTLGRDRRESEQWRKKRKQRTTT